MFIPILRHSVRMSQGDLLLWKNSHFDSQETNSEMLYEFCALYAVSFLYKYMVNSLGCICCSDEFMKQHQTRFKHCQELNWFRLDVIPHSDAQIVQHCYAEATDGS